MSETIQLALAFSGALLAGLLLGAIFFGGLWWTVQKGVSAWQPVLWFSLSLLLRVSIALTGFYFVGGSDWKRLLVCLGGFIIARLIVTRLTGKAVSPKTNIGEASHAP